MSFCPSCGAENAVEARFCNKCGTAIAIASKAAPPASSTAPSTTGGSITLAGIGIRSQRQTNTFLALGAGIAWIGMHSGRGDPVATGDATSAVPTGDAIPTGVDVPGGDFVMTSGARVVKRGGSSPSASVVPPPSSDPSADTTPPPPEATRAGHTPRAPHETHVAATTTGSPDPTSGSVAPPPHTTTSTGGSAPPPSTAVDWAALGDTVPADGSEEPDYQVQLYATRVRRFIRTNLLPQATSCFEHASATSRDPISGSVVIGFDIDARGHAQGATIDRNTTHLETLGRCLQANVNSWQLPPPPAGTAPLQMQMPFTR